MRNLLLKFILISQFLVGFLAYGQESVEDLIEMNERPNMLMVEPLLEEYKFPKDIPIDSQWAQQNNVDSRTDIKVWTKILLEHSPKLLAIFEKIYPGGTWVFMGRDGAAFADVFEAFYETLGQKNRVIRLGVSKDSFDGMTIKHIDDVFKQAGYSLSDWKNQASLLFVDPVSKGNGRQGRTLISYIYAHLIKNKGAKLEDLIHKINMIGLIVSTHSGQYYSTSNPTQYLKDYAAIIKDQNPKTARDIFNSHIFMGVDQAPNFANESGYTHFIGAWHDSFGKFYMEKRKTAKTKLGKSSPDEVKMSILWTQNKIWKAVKSPKFLARVQAEAKALGYTFPVKGPKKDCVKMIKAGKE